MASLAERFAVSRITIRRDLARLEEQGLIVKTHGGAVAIGAKTHAEVRLSERERLFQKEKQRIGECAAALVQKGQTVILDEGSTCLAVARQLRGHSDITVITNGVRVAAELVGAAGVTLVVIGGVCNHESAMLYGPETERAYQALHADLYFMGIDAFSSEHGIMDGNYLQVSLKQAKAAVSRRVIGVAHQAKFGRLAFAHVGPLHMLQGLVTDGPVAKELELCLLEHDIECIKA